MATKSTHIYKTVGDLDLKVDVYIKISNEQHTRYNSRAPIYLFFHGGGLVGFNRIFIPPHIVQLCLFRNWILVSADYRLLPQVTGKEIVEDAKDAYTFVREKLGGILAGTKSGEATVMKNIIIGGPRAYLSMVTTHYLNPKPLAVFTYCGGGSMQADFFRTNRVHEAQSMTQGRIQKFLDEAPNSGYTPPAHAFDPSCLLPDSSPNPDWTCPEEDGQQLHVDLFPYLLEQNMYPELLKEVDKNLEDEVWKSYPPFITVHGDQDVDAPYESSVNVCKVIGPTPAQLFTAPGQPHAFETKFFMGDPGLEIVEEAWRTLDKVVQEKAK